MVDITGVDVAVWQGDIDFTALAGGTALRFAYIRLCKGLNEFDTKAVQNMRGFAQIGVPFGLYHRIDTTQGSPEQHALYFLSCLRQVLDEAPAPHLAHALDYENDVMGGGPWCRSYMAGVRGVTGDRRYVLYSSGSWFGKQIGPEAYADPEVKLWVADTGKWTGATPGNPKFKHPQSVIHQYSHEGRVPGIGPNCDLDMLIGPMPVRS
ncbi:glycoside hydrolase family 25 protein [Kibdelosporangium philippinense]|uniref:Glycoside hydrolase family 25 protein n=1 Tax=Kibdelosporangium philippinense TaxID=211113 RepID=A0ABS8Z5V1_9PSEU|nr:glycoside hydrolase family 25 protein [Kibdelosporangium philippinense]MCE7003185.1 glycoside hydrolase family 25 protein [Kibdelosporangium philippinense]